MVEQSWMDFLIYIINILYMSHWLPRTCSECKEWMSDWYCIENGSEYYCSDKCLHKHYSNIEYQEMYDDWNWDSYWTEWENNDLEEE